MIETPFKILLVAHYSPETRFSPLVVEQAESLRAAGQTVEIFGVTGGGTKGYLKNLSGLKKKLAEFKPDIVHAYYGLSGLLANLQRKYPVVTTYMGSDIHSGGWLLKLSRLCMRLSKFNIFVSPQLVQLAMKKPGRSLSFAIVPGGVDMKTFFPVEKKAARAKLAESLVKDLFEEDVKYVLFAGSFSNAVKNVSLAFEAVEKLGAKLLELRGYSREQVNLLLNCADCLLMTSDREGSPMIIKEAMAVGCPVVSVDVGDVSEVVSGVHGCYIAERSSEDIAEKLSEALKYSRAAVADPESLEGRRRLLEKELGGGLTAKRLIGIYDLLLNGVR